jgi:hypothetical protein
MSKTFPKQIDKNFDFDVSFSSTFCFIAFRVFLSDGSLKSPQKMFYKKILSKSFNKKIDKNPKPIFSRFVYQVFGRFSVGGVQNTTKRYREKI